MPNRTITVDGTPWRVAPSGRITQYDLDEFGLIFSRGAGESHETRVTRYSPVGPRSREQSFAELTDTQLHELFHQSQPGQTSPEVRYGR